MRQIMVAAVIALLPMTALAQTDFTNGQRDGLYNTPPSGYQSPGYGAGYTFGQDMRQDTVDRWDRERAEHERRMNQTDDNDQ